MTPARTLLPGLLLLGGAACATTGATLGSGVGDASLDNPPWRAGARTALPAGTRVGVLPVVYQSPEPGGDPTDPSRSPESELSRLLAELNAGTSALVAATGAQPVALALPAGDDGRVPPDVRFGCTSTTGMPGRDCAIDDEVPNAQRERMALAVGRPSAAWIAAAQDAMTAASVDQLLVLTVELADYPVRQRGITGRKSVVLGVDHEVAQPWLTAIDRPVSVIQLTGALIGRDGRAVRIAAEGLLARRTELLLGAIGAQRVITDEDIAALRAAHREDRPGRPTVAQAALAQVVRSLVGG